MMWKRRLPSRHERFQEAPVYSSVKAALNPDNTLTNSDFTYDLGVVCILTSGPTPDAFLAPDPSAILGTRVLSEVNVLAGP